MEKLQVGMYVRTPKGIGKVTNVYNETYYGVVYTDIDYVFEQYLDDDGTWTCYHEVTGASYDIRDLVEYMDLIELKKPVKLYGTDKEKYFLNPVRVDGFTEFEDGTHCIILDMDYIADVKDLKIKSILTYEQYLKGKYNICNE